MKNEHSEYAKIEISVTTAGGILPVGGATVAVIYNTVPGICDSGRQIRLTDKEGRAGTFELPVRRAIIGGKNVDFPRRAECDVEIKADGYVDYRARAVHLFPEVTVVSNFDLIAK